MMTCLWLHQLGRLPLFAIVSLAYAIPGWLDGWLANLATPFDTVYVAQAVTGQGHSTQVKERQMKLLETRKFCGRLGRHPRHKEKVFATIQVPSRAGFFCQSRASALNLC
jgi:ribosomal protein L33